jgi:segregation and condensation protein B
MNSLGHQLRSAALRYQPRSAVGGGEQRGSSNYDARRLHKLPNWPSEGGNLPAAGRFSQSRRSRLEAVLFLSREPLSLRKMAHLANLTDGTEARTLLNSLRERYDERGCAFQVAQVAGGYQLMSRPNFAGWLRPFSGGEQEIRLSPPALETLAVVAHRQPVLRAEIEAIRGVGCGEILRQLMDRDLLRIVGRSEELGRPLWYGTTKRFLQLFGLCHLDQLPLATELRRTSLVGQSSESVWRMSPEEPITGLTDDVDAA